MSLFLSNGGVKDNRKILLCRKSGGNSSSLQQQEGRTLTDRSRCVTPDSRRNGPVDFLKARFGREPNPGLHVFSSSVGQPIFKVACQLTDVGCIAESLLFVFCGFDVDAYRITGCQQSSCFLVGLAFASDLTEVLIYWEFKRRDLNTLESLFLRLRLPPQHDARRGEGSCLFRCEH